MYLPTLLERKKWNLSKRNMKVADLVLLADESFPRRGQLDEYLRSYHESRWIIANSAVKVKTSSSVATSAKRQRKREPVITVSLSILARPVTKLCLQGLDGEAEANGSI